MAVKTSVAKLCFSGAGQKVFTVRSVDAINMSALDGKTPAELYFGHSGSLEDCINKKRVEKHILNYRANCPAQGLHLNSVLRKLGGWLDVMDATTIGRISKLSRNIKCIRWKHSTTF